MEAKKDVTMLRDATSARKAGARGPYAAPVVAIAAVVLVFVGGTLACNQVKTGGDSPGMTKAEEFVPGEIIVWFDDGASEEDDYVAAYRKLDIVQVAERNRVVEAFAADPAPEPGGEMKTKIGGE
jgi:hypothetical protein